jgi:hypothetical protein
MQIQLTIQQLEAILKNAKLFKEDSNLSDTIAINTLDEYEGHLGGNMVDAFLRNKDESKEDVKIY